MFSAQNWKYYDKSQKLKNQNGDWKFEAHADYLKWKLGKGGIKNYYTLKNTFQRYFTAEVISFKDLLHDGFLDSRSSYHRRYVSRRYSFLEYVRGNLYSV